MNKRFEVLDAFRGLCALSVVVFHMRFVDSITELKFFMGSGLFVEFFFVLSGFVLAHGYGFKYDLKFKAFMKARFFRLYPLHFVMFIFVIIFNIIKLLAGKYLGVSFSSEAFTGMNTVSGIIPNLLLIHSWTPFTEPYSFNGPSWSISIEFYMYALLFASIALFKSNRIISWFIISLMAFTLILLESKLLVTEVLSGLSCFFGGAFTYVIYKKTAHFKPSYTLGSIVEALLLLSVFFVVESQSELRSSLGPVVFIFTVLFFAFESGFFSDLLKIRPFQYAGKLSYSIYMTHFVLLFYITALFKVLNSFTSIEMLPVIGDVRFKTLSNVALNNITVVFILALVIYISSLTYKYIELKGQKLNRK